MEKMDYILEGRGILYDDSQLGPYPEQLLPRVEVPTNALEDGRPRRKSHVENAEGQIKLRDDLPPALIKLKAGMKEKKEPIAQALTQVRAHARTIRQTPNPVSETPAPIPENSRVLSRHLKSFGYFLGADQMGICEIPEYGMYLDDPDGRPIGLDYKYAVVFAKRKHIPTTLASDGHDWIFDACSHQCYQALGQWSETMANYIRRLGYQALASNSRNYVTVMPSLLLAAGFGESGRMGIVVNPFFGANFKSACVLTNMPLEPDKPIDFGLQEYCRSCGICAQQCVSGAISKSNETICYNGYRKYRIDYMKCAVLNMANQRGGVCGRCAAICPWNRPDSTPESYMGWNGDLSFLYDSVNRRAEYLREHNFVTQESESRKWWFDLKEENGRYIIPKSTAYTPVPAERNDFGGR